MVAGREAPEDPPATWGVPRSSAGPGLQRALRVRLIQGPDAVLRVHQVRIPSSGSLLGGDHITVRRAVSPLRWRGEDVVA